MILNTHPENRKAMVKAICELTGMNATYLFTPTYAYQIGPIAVNRDGSIDCEDEAMVEAIKPVLIEHGWLEAEETPEAPADFKDMPETAAPISVGQMDMGNCFLIILGDGLSEINSLLPAIMEHA